METIDTPSTLKVADGGDEYKHLINENFPIPIRISLNLVYTES